jgi:predicted amidohydrolase
MHEDSAKTLHGSCIQMHWAKPMLFNLHRTLHHIKAAAEDGSRLVPFPESSLTSYAHCRSADQSAGRKVCFLKESIQT